MQPEVATLLLDMKNGVERITRFAAGKTYDDYLSDDLLRSGIERQFEIIGEAMTRLAKLDPATAAKITDHRKIAGFRNALVHGYDHIDDKISWGIVTTKLPLLHQELHALLAE
jgi:uncharacterized protein with HEPN domain